MGFFKDLFIKGKAKSEPEQVMPCEETVFELPEKYISIIENLIKTENPSKNVNVERENKEYRRYTKVAEHNKALSLLYGITQGIDSDGAISDAEIEELLNWCTAHAHLQSRNPFKDLLPMILDALADGVLSDEEREDILWVCRKNHFGRDYYDDVTNSLQVLCGIAHGLLADKELSDKEILALSDWVSANDYLAGNYPFDEITEHLNDVLEDGVITQCEREELILLLSSLIQYDDSLNLTKDSFEDMRKRHSSSGIYDECPQMEVSGKAFCITGNLEKYALCDALAMIEEMGGINKDKMSSKVDFLVVGNLGSPAWSHSCYGRKIEQAIELKKKGKPVHIVKEDDLWKALRA